MPNRHTLIEKDNTAEEWTEFRAKLDLLNVDQLKRLADALNIHFAPDADVSADEYRDVLDESYWDDFEREYALILNAQ